jgi:hypothetical protein
MLLLVRMSVSHVFVTFQWQLNAVDIMLGNSYCGSYKLNL